jgi:hypothetical protein
MQRPNFDWPEGGYLYPTELMKWYDISTECIPVETPETQAILDYRVILTPESDNLERMKQKYAIERIGINVISDGKDSVIVRGQEYMVNQLREFEWVLDIKPYNIRIQFEANYSTGTASQSITTTGWHPEFYPYPVRHLQFLPHAEGIDRSVTQSKPLEKIVDDDPQACEKERHHLIELLRSFERSGTVKSDEVERILASNMTNKEIGDFLVNLVD